MPDVSRASGFGEIDDVSGGDAVVDEAARRRITDDADSNTLAEASDNDGNVGVSSGSEASLGEPIPTAFGLPGEAPCDPCRLDTSGEIVSDLGWMGEPPDAEPENEDDATGRGSPDGIVSCIENSGSSTNGGGASPEDSTASDLDRIDDSSATDDTAGG